MSREKKPYNAVVRAVGGITQVPPGKPGTEEVWRGYIPAIDCVMADGRRVLVTFEMPYSPNTTRAGQASRMRTLAATLLRAADRVDHEAWGATQRPVCVNRLEGADGARVPAWHEDVPPVGPNDGDSPQGREDGEFPELKDIRLYE